VGIERLYLRNLAKLVETNKFTRRGLPVKGGSAAKPCPRANEASLSPLRLRPEGLRRQCVCLNHVVQWQNRRPHELHLPSCVSSVQSTQVLCQQHTQLASIGPLYSQLIRT
jgi:hypothetical protein